MRASIFFQEPNILREAKAGDLFVPHSAELQECVCAISSDESGLGPWLGDTEAEVVVVACRVNEGEIGYRRTGYSETVSLDCWITFVESFETLAFRERYLDGREPPAVATEREPPKPPRCTCGAAATPNE